MTILHLNLGAAPLKPGGIAPAGAAEEELSAIIADACPPELTEEYMRNLRPSLNGPVLKSDWQSPMKAATYRGCFLELPGWMMRLAFNLAHFGMSEGLSPATVADLTELLTIQTMGKEEYLVLGRHWEKLSATGLDPNTLGQVFRTGLSERFRGARFETFLLVYALHRQKGAEHKAALNLAVKIVPEIVRQTKGKEADFPSKALELVQSDLPRSRSGTVPTGDELWDILEGRIPAERIVIPVGAWNVPRMADFVKSWIGSPYKFGGVSKNGVDCSGFVLQVMLDQFPEARLPRGATAMSALGKKVSVAASIPGDLVFFGADPGSTRITHVGIFLGDGKFAHASSTRGVVIDPLGKDYYTRRLITIQRLF